MPSSASALDSSASLRKVSLSELVRTLTVMRDARRRAIVSASFLSRMEAAIAIATPISKKLASTGPIALRSFISNAPYEKLWLRVQSNENKACANRVSSYELRFGDSPVTRSLSALHLKTPGNSCYDSEEKMRGFHLVAGMVAVTAFLITGQFMRHHQPPMATLGDAARLMFRSRHIYILAAGLINLMLGLYLELQVASWRRTVQIAGSVLLLGSLVPLVLAFVLEPDRGFRSDMR